MNVAVAGKVGTRVLVERGASVGVGETADWVGLQDAAIKAGRQININIGNFFILIGLYPIVLELNTTIWCSSIRNYSILYNPILAEN